MLIPKELEAKIVAALAAAFLPRTSKFAVSTSGSWQPAEEGLVRWIESNAGAPAFVHVSVGTAIPKTYTTGEVEFAAKIALFVRTECDPQGEILVAAAETIENLLRSWQSQTYQQAFDALDIPNGFYVGDVVGGQGDAPLVQDGFCRVAWPLTISGSYQSPPL